MDYGSSKSLSKDYGSSKGYKLGFEDYGSSKGLSKEYCLNCVESLVLLTHAILCDSFCQG